MSNQEDLKTHILERSESQIFEEARREWEIEGVNFDDPDMCPCGQAIREKCWIYNRKTHCRTFVGNVCVHRFMNLAPQSLFTGLKRVVEGGRANQSTIECWAATGLLSEKEKTFLMDIRHKRKLSPKQQAWEQAIQKRILT